MMHATLVNEIESFLYCAYIGFLLVITYDMFRCLRRLIKHNIFFICIEDLFFWMAWTIYILEKLIGYGCGIRLYYFTAFLLGSLFTICIFEILFMPFAFKICEYFNKIIVNVIMMLKNNLKLVKIKPIILFKETNATDKVVPGVSKSKYEKKFKKKIN